MESDRTSIDKNIAVMHDWESAETLEKFCSVMIQAEPLFFSRIGGSDYECVRDYFNDPEVVNNYKWYKHNYQKVRSHNGYFDFENKQENFVKYLETMLRCYKDSNAVTYGNTKLINSFESGQFLGADASFINHICQNKVCVNYTFIEGIHPFLKSLHNWLNNKKILIVSPLSQSIEYQFKNKDKLYNNYTFPNFELSTYNTKITYSDKDNHRTAMNVTTSNWLEEAGRMSEEIAKLDFDIALLSCGSYAMYLGDFIKHKLNKKSLYLGGILNMLFNIYGGRYNQHGYVQLGLRVRLDPAYQIDPFENEDVKNIKSGRDFKTESLRAYFGTNPINVKKDHNV
jgi:hypothetical protein